MVRDMWRWKTGQRDEMWLEKDGGREPWAQKNGQPLEAGKGKERDFVASRKEYSTAHTLTSVQWDLCWMSDLKNYKINWCFKSLTLWQFVKAVIETIHLSLPCLSCCDSPKIQMLMGYSFPQIPSTAPNSFT